MLSVFLHRKVFGFVLGVAGAKPPAAGSLGASTSRGGCFGAPTPGPAFEHLSVMQKPVEHGTHRGGIAEQFAPVLDRTIGSQQGAGAFVTAHYDFQQILGGSEWQFAHAEVVND